MKKLTKTQVTTLIALIMYLAYELGYVREWAANLPPSDPIIRLDLVIIYPFLLVLVGISLYQYFKR